MTWQKHLADGDSRWTVIWPGSVPCFYQGPPQSLLSVCIAISFGAE